MSIPQYLYRYEPCEERRVNCLLHGELWLSKAIHFDDELDCNIRVDTRVDYLQTIAIYHDLISGRTPSQNWDVLARSFPTFSTVDGIRRNADRIIEHYKNRFRTIHGIYCLSEDSNNPKLWNEYSKGNGYCVEFNTTFEPFNSAYKVKYFSDPPMFTLDSILRHEIDLITEMVTSKSDKWAYQNEWRIFRVTGDTTIPFDHSAINRIYLSKSFSPDFKKRLEAAFGKTKVTII